MTRRYSNLRLKYRMTQVVITCYINNVGVNESDTSTQIKIKCTYLIKININDSLYAYNIRAKYTGRRSVKCLS